MLGQRMYTEKEVTQIVSSYADLVECSNRLSEYTAAGREVDARSLALLLKEERIPAFKKSVPSYFPHHILLAQVHKGFSLGALEEKISGVLDGSESPLPPERAHA